MAIVLDIDDLDRAIINLKIGNPGISQTEISKTLGISQPAINKRMHQLKKEGYLKEIAGIDLSKVKLYLAKSDISSDNTEQILEHMKKCPLYIQGFVTNGKFDLTVFVVGEDPNQILTYGNRRLRQNNDVKDSIKEMEWRLMVKPDQDFTIPIKPIIKKQKNPPCGADCKKCNMYDRCLGCPATEGYKGKLL